MIKNFSLFKNDKKTDKEPDYRISAKVGEDFKEVGACWIKQGKSGTYLSCQLSKPYKDRAGFTLTEEKTFNPELGEVDQGSLPDTGF